MSMNILEKVSLWLTLFSISFCIVFLFNNNVEGAIASGMTTASVKTPFMLVHQCVWSKLKRSTTDQ
ncbi:hypothetical protein Pan241w_58330 [Gimesia alba]|uniref:DUF2061 domain-containing protein n=1 Tax=Gimesia alba TaxID=2527973 RepID=A0A517RP85_9PLAN|nr:hypothetical protein Pan241w_58330 [Gimesia alba]